MNVEENLKIINILNDAINTKNLDKIVELLDESIIYIGPAFPTPQKGINAFLEHFKDFFNAFPDGCHDKVRSFGQGDWVCIEVIWRGTHTRPYTSREGQPIPPTNKRVQLQACELYKIKDIKVMEVHMYYDILGFLTQLGIR